MNGESDNLCDRNKTDLTRKVTAGVVSWMRGNGFKPIETEVSVDAGWVADAAGVLRPTRTEAQDLKLIPRKPKWPSNPERRESFHAALNEQERLYQVLPDPLTALVEVKTSRADFCRDQKWGRAELPCDLCYLAVPRDLFDTSECPAAWGLLSCDPESGAVLRMTRAATLAPVTIEQRLSVVLDIAMRRDNATRYVRLREWQRQARIERNENHNRSKLADVIRVMTKIVRGQGNGIDDVLMFSSVKCPDYLRKELEALWNVAPLLGIEA